MADANPDTGSPGPPAPAEVPGGWLATVVGRDLASASAAPGAAGPRGAGATGRGVTRRGARRSSAPPLAQARRRRRARHAAGASSIILMRAGRRPLDRALQASDAPSLNRKSTSARHPRQWSMRSWESARFRRWGDADSHGRMDRRALTALAVDVDERLTGPPASEPEAAGAERRRVARSTGRSPQCARPLPRSGPWRVQASGCRGTVRARRRRRQATAASMAGIRTSALWGATSSAARRRAP